MKKVSIILTAMALVMAMTQCNKKNNLITPTDESEAVVITLNVGGSGNGEKVVVNPATGLVDFESGDAIYVGSGGKYVGTLTYDGSVFTGAISNATEGYPLQFYFLGNVTPAEALTSGITESCSVVISDQTTSLPVISAAPSNENYAASTTNYTAHLLNKCALVKFNVTTLSSAATCITGFNNKVTVSFTENALTYSKKSGGNIILPADNGEKWAILLPQEAMEAGAVGSAYSQDGVYTGIRGAVPVISENGYLTTGIQVGVTIEVNPGEVPTGAVNGKFTINADGDQVYFSQGNLQYQASTDIWRFAANQYDYVGEDNANVSSTYSGWIDLFGWGTSGYNHGANCYQPWSTSTTISDYYAYGSSSYNLYDQNGQADWGYNAISNGGNAENSGWRTLTKDEWYYVRKSRPTLSGIHYAKGMVNGVRGIILLPDNWYASAYNLNNTDEEGVDFTSNSVTATDWIVLEANGAVFLPAAGHRGGISVSEINAGFYWSASSKHQDGGLAYDLYFDSLGIATTGYHYGYSRSVRLVRNVE